MYAQLAGCFHPICTEYFAFVSVTLKKKTLEKHMVSILLNIPWKTNFNGLIISSNDVF